MADQPPPSFSSDNPNASAVCVECGNTFSQGDMIRHGNVFICANCKPVFMQKLAEGAKIDSREMHYAGFWIRFLARFLDGIISGVVIVFFAFIFGLILAMFIGATKTASGQPVMPAALGLGIFIVEIVCIIGYEVFFLGKFGATPGKMIFKLKVVTADGEPISYKRALGRYFCFFLNVFTIYIGFIIAGFDSEKRALHDRICNTRVIYTNK